MPEQQNFKFNYVFFLKLYLFVVLPKVCLNAATKIKSFFEF